MFELDAFTPQRKRNKNEISSVPVMNNTSFYVAAF